MRKKTPHHHRYPISIIGLCLLALATGLFLFPPHIQAADTYIMVVKADGAIVPAMENYIDRAINKAEDDKVALVVIELDTPGGSIQTTEDIIQRIHGADVPVVVYVAPRGAMAASAGSLITLSGHISAMSPGTVIGAASPINGDGSDLNETSDKKAKEILTANMRSLTEHRSPEAQELAVAMITEAQAVTANEALQIGLIDIIAANTDDLLTQLEGRSVEVDNQSVELQLAGLERRTFEMNIIEQLLMVLTNPTIVFTLLSTGIVLIIIEFRAPGGWVAGTLGAVLVAISLYGLGVLPVNFLGLIFIGMAFILFMVEIYIPDTQGAIAVAASIALAVGGLIMFNNSAVRQFGGVSVALIVLQSAALAVMGALITAWLVRTIKGPSTTGSEGMVGMIGQVYRTLEPFGIILVNGERWQAESTNGVRVEEGQAVRVEEISGLLVKVEAIDEVVFPNKKKN